MCVGPEKAYLIKLQLPIRPLKEGKNFRVHLLSVLKIILMGIQYYFLVDCQISVQFHVNFVFDSY